MQIKELLQDAEQLKADHREGANCYPEKKIVQKFFKNIVIRSIRL